MSNNSETIKAFNELLQGEYMAVDSFNNFISRLEDKNAIECLREVQKQHRENIDKLATYIQDKGVNMAEKVLRGDLDHSSRGIAGEILEKDRKSIEKLNKLL